MKYLNWLKFFNFYTLPLWGGLFNPSRSGDGDVARVLSFDGVIVLSFDGVIVLSFEL